MANEPSSTQSATQNHSYDAIVIGTGITGGWAAKELTQKGLKTLVLDRGRDVKHGDYPTATKDIWEFPYGGRATDEDLKRQAVAARSGYAITQASKHWFVDDTENPYVEIKRFDWIRGYHVGGRSIMWGRQSYRWSDIDFGANAKDGIAVDWPVRYAEIAPWYDHVEGFIGVSGSREGLPQLPDGQFMKPMEMNIVEKDMAARLKDHYKNGRHMIIGRTANITEPLPGRTNCQYRDKCWLGCPFGGYFSTQSSTLPAAMATGKLTLRPWSIVTQVLYDKDKKRATGVEILDAETNKTYRYQSKIVFLNASTINS